MRIIVILLITAQLSFGILPGFKTSISSQGLDYARQVGIQLLQQAIGQIQIPDASGTADTPIGGIDWKLSNIVLGQVQISSSSVSLLPGQGISLSLSQVSCSVSMNWWYREHGWPHITDSGSADVSASGITASVAIQITEQNGQPVVNTLSDTVTIGNLDIHLHGGASWLYQIFVNIFSGDIKKGIQNGLEQGITTNINNGLNDALSTAQLYAYIDNLVEVDFPLLSNPVFTNDYLSISQLGEFYQINNKQECPSSICPNNNEIPDHVTNNELQMILSDFIANSAGFTYFNLNLLRTIITDDMLPPSSPVRLNTTSFRYLIPALYDYFPNQLMGLTLYLTQSPSIQFSQTGAYVIGIGNIDVNVVFENGTWFNSFTLSGTIKSSGQAFLDGTTIYGNLTYLNGNFKLSKSNIGDIDVSAFVGLLDLLLSTGVVPGVNYFLKEGFPLPTIQGIIFENPSLVWGQNYLCVSTDVIYTPPTQSSSPLKLIKLINNNNNNNNNNKNQVINIVN